MVLRCLSSLRTVQPIEFLAESITARLFSPRPAPPHCRRESFFVKVPLPCLNSGKAQRGGTNS